MSGGGDFEQGETDVIDTRMLTRSDADGPLVYIGAAHDELRAEAYLDYLGELGGRSGFAIDIIMEDDNTLETQISEAGIVVIGDGPDFERLFNGMHGAAIKAVHTAYLQGAVVIGHGAGAEIFGQYVMRDTRENPRKGFSWLQRAAIFSNQPGPAEKAALQKLLSKKPTSFGLGIRPESALALGPNNMVELWGNQQIAISLGQAYTTQNLEDDHD